jgi:hypothetical protein
MIVVMSFARTGVLLLCAAAMGKAALLRIEFSDRSDVLEGREFGRSGAYERIVGKAYFAVDPNLPANQIIADIARAPRNENGLVEFSADIYVLKPRDPARGNGAALFEVSNRGGKGMLGIFDLAKSSVDPRSAQEFGDGFLLEQGYTLVWLGWQFDVPQNPGLMRLYAPVIHGLTGLVRAEYTPDAPGTVMPLADRGHIPYLVVNPDDPKLTLTMRDSADAPRRAIPRSAWSVRNRREVVMHSGFEPGHMYELVYTSEDPTMVGLGPAAVRDLISFLKYGGNDITMLGDQRRYIRWAYGFGVSQSGRFLRTFLYYGFNRDEKSRRVFDGMMVHVAGAGRGSFNFRFAQPSRDGHPFLNTFYPTDIFPFTDLEESDPESGAKDGLLARTPDSAVPKIFYTNSAYEYYGRAASLIHTTPDGKQDATLPSTTRIYFFAGGQHGPSAFPPRTDHAQNLANPNRYTLAMRALLVDLNAWVQDGKEPPPSQYPRVGSDQLVSLGAVQFPKIPGVQFPTRIQKAWRVDYGPEFRSEGIVTVEPPKVGEAFPVLVPQVDADGNDMGGIRMPEVQVPLATYTGWNLRAPEIGAPGELYSMRGSWIPFARTAAERENNGDPRRSVAERYATREEYLQRVGAAARTLADRGLLLDRDVAAVIERGGEEWDYVMSRK